MTTYFAICDDNIADRKQTERLLEREKDKRLSESGDVMYIESFGSSDTLLTTPIRYDMFIIDITNSQPNGMDIAKSLRASGIIAPICLLTSTVDYNSYANQPDNIIHMVKPISQGQISHLFDVARVWACQKPTLLEIRGKNETFFVPREELIRAAERKNHVEVVLADGTYVQVPGSLKDFIRSTGSFECFIDCNNSILNIYHIKNFDNHVFTMSNGETYHIPRFKAEEILSRFVSFTASHISGENK